jgi:DNA polymerase-3 subunit alpha
LENAAARIKKGLRIFFSDAAKIEQIASRIGKKGDGEISLILKLAAGNQEIEMRLPGGYQVTPQIASAIKAVPGVLQVLDI